VTTVAPPVHEEEGPGVTTLELFFDLAFDVLFVEKRDRPALISALG
jgi:hypothetical protein